MSLIHRHDIVFRSSNNTERILSDHDDCWIKPVNLVFFNTDLFHCIHRSLHQWLVHALKYILNLVRARSHLHLKNRMIKIRILQLETRRCCMHASLRLGSGGLRGRAAWIKVPITSFASMWHEFNNYKEFHWFVEIRDYFLTYIVTVGTEIRPVNGRFSQDFCH